MTQALIGALRVDFSARTAAFEKGVTEVQRRLKQVERDLNRAAREMQKVGQKLSIGLTAPLAALGVASTKLAMEVEEMQSAFNIAFGGSSDAVREWAKETGKTMGRATHTLQGDALQFQKLLAGMLDPEMAVEMSKQLAVLSQDLTSFHDLADGDAMTKLFSGILGESEPLSRLGVNLKAAAVEAKALEMGFVKVNGQFTESEKVQARLALIMQETALAQGDVVRTADSASNGMRTAKEAFEQLQVTIGTKLIPALTPLVEKITALIERFNNLSPRMQNIIITAGALAAALGPVIVALSSVLVPLGKLGFSIATLLSAGGIPALVAAFAAAAAPIAVLTGAVLALKAAYDILAPMMGKTAKAAETLNGHVQVGENLKYRLANATDENRDALEQETKAYLDNARAQLAAAKAAQERQMKGAKTASLFALSNPAARSAQVKLLQDAAATAREIDRQEALISDLEGRLGSTGSGTQPRTPPPSLTVPIAPIADATNETETRKAVAEAIKTETQARREALQAKIDEAAQREQSDADIEQRLMRQMQGHTDATRAAIDQARAHRELAAAYKVSNAEGRLVAEMQRLQANGVELTTAKLRELAQETLRSSDMARDAMDRAGQDATTAGDAMQNAFQRGADAFTGLVNAIKSGDIGSILQQGIGFLQQLFGGSGGGGGGSLGGLFKNGSVAGGAGGGLGSAIGMFAGLFDRGGRIPAGQWGIAGERGPEIVRGPASITSRLSTARMMRGSAMTDAMRGGAMPPVRFEVVGVEGGTFGARVRQISGDTATPIAQAHSQGAIREAQRSAAKRSGRQLGVR